MNLHYLQVRVREWSDRNFGEQPAYRPLLGAVEEIGELCHAHLKNEQGIRRVTDEAALAAKEDAVADVLIYLADYCGRSGISMDDAVTRTWEKVSQRDWKNNPSGAADGED